MKELRNKVLAALSTYNQGWVDTINKAKETREIDVSSMITKMSEINKELNQQFDFFESRHDKTKKGFWGKG